MFGLLVMVLFGGADTASQAQVSFTGVGDLSGGDIDGGAQAVSADGTVVTGRSMGTNGLEAYRWTEANGIEGIGDLAGNGFDSAAGGVSADGQAIVGRGASASGTEAFRWLSGSMIGLGDLDGGGFGSSANGVSADGMRVVGAGTTAVGSETFIWDPSGGMRRLHHVLSVDFGLDLTGWALVRARSISDDGFTIVGDGVNPDGNNEGWVARIGPVIPEPSTTILLGAAVAAFVARGRGHLRRGRGRHRA